MLPMLGRGWTFGIWNNHEFADIARSLDSCETRMDGRLPEIKLGSKISGRTGSIAHTQRAHAV